MNFGNLTLVFEFSFGQMRLFRLKFALYNLELSETNVVRKLTHRRMPRKNFSLIQLQLLLVIQESHPKSKPG